MSQIQAILLAALQGVTELFPVSSLGHAVILPRLLGWQVDQHSPAFLPFLVMLHLGTAAALLLYFWRDWIEILAGILGQGSGVAESRRLLLLLVAGTLPAAVIGFLLEKFFRSLFGAPEVAALFLALNGVVLLAAERLRRRASTGGAAALTLRQAALIGLCQAGALIPGLSRSGLTMGAGLAVGLSHAEAARFSFLLATPIIAGAGVLELPKLLHATADGGIGLGLSVLAGLVAGVTAFASTAFLMRFFKSHEFKALNPFAYYCLAAGGLAFVLLAFVL
ncbi:MAG TPA: undecaprenyl-diphosphate phosphatase [Candidatus Udaeobacter sp.]|nr:undecaprenyl-diphosphate phosphatase [Candidatus Udaeobacter sp.]